MAKPQKDNLVGNITVGTFKTALGDFYDYVLGQDDVTSTPQPNKILRLDANAKLPASITGDADTVDGKHADNTANNLCVLDANGKVPQDKLPLNINADTVDGYHANSFALTGHIHTDASTIKPALNASGDAPIYACRAWVNFDGTTSPPTIRASGNVSSVTKNGVGDYTINFTTPMIDVNYSFSATGSDDDVVHKHTYEGGYGQKRTTSSIRVLNHTDSQGLKDSKIMCFVAFR